MKKEFLMWLLPLIPNVILVAIVTYASSMLGEVRTRNKIQQQAVDAGVAIYTTDKYGKNREFKWLTNYTVIEMPAIK